MSATRTSPFVVSLDIGGLGIDLACNDARLAELLARRYRNFPPASPRRFRASIQFEAGDNPASLLLQPLQFQRGVLVYDAPDFQGYVDPVAGQGSLTLRCQHPEIALEYYLRVMCALLVFQAGGLLFHAAAVQRGGRAFAFFGPSGSGKSTVASLSVQDVVVNDDLVILRPEGNLWQVHATPFWNQYRGESPAPPAPLAGLFRLVQDRRHFVEHMDAACAVAEMIASLPVLPADRARAGQLIARCQSILDCVPAYRLHFLPDASFWGLVEGMV